MARQREAPPIESKARRRRRDPRERLQASPQFHPSRRPACCCCWRCWVQRRVQGRGQGRSQGATVWTGPRAPSGDQSLAAPQLPGTRCKALPVMPRPAQTSSSSLRDLKMLPQRPPALPAQPCAVARKGAGRCQRWVAWPVPQAAVGHPRQRRFAPAGARLRARRLGPPCQPRRREVPRSLPSSHRVLGVAW